MRRANPLYLSTLSLLAVNLMAGPAYAQLTYDRSNGGADKQTATSTDLKTQKVLKESVETLKQGQRVDWVSLFLLWYRTQTSVVTNALNIPAARDSFMHFVGCDSYILYQQNDVLWPQQQQAIINHANNASQNPVKRFRILLRAPLGAYNHQTQAFDFTPISGKGFNITFPEKTAFGVESNCENLSVIPRTPWPSVFQITFTNPEFIQTLPVPPEKAASLLQERRNDKGEIDRNLYMDIELDVDDFVAAPSQQDNKNTDLLPWIAHVHALRAVAYENERRNVVVGQWGFQTTGGPDMVPSAKPAGAEKQPETAPLSINDLTAASPAVKK